MALYAYQKSNLPGIVGREKTRNTSVSECDATTQAKREYRVWGANSNKHFFDFPSAENSGKSQVYIHLHCLLISEMLKNSYMDRNRDSISDEMPSLFFCTPT